MGLLYDIIKKRGLYEVYIEDNFRDAAREVENYFKTDKKEI